MKKLESPYMQIGLSKEFYTRQEVKALREKVDEIINWINKRERKDKKK